MLYEYFDAIKQRDQKQRIDSITFENTAKELIRKAVLNSDVAAIKLIASCLDGSLPAYLAKIDNQTQWDYHNKRAQDIISSVYNSVNGSYIVIGGDDENSDHYISADVAEAILDAFDGKCSPFEKFNNDFSSRVSVEEDLHDIHLANNTPITTQFICFLSGNVPHELSPGFMNIDAGNKEVIFNPIASALVSVHPKRFTSIQIARPFEVRRRLHFRDNCPINLPIEAVAHCLIRDAYNTINDNSSNGNYERFANDLSNELSLYVERGKDYAAYLSKSVKHAIEQINALTTVDDLLALLEDVGLPQHVALDHGYAKTDMTAPAGNFITESVDAAYFAYSLMKKIENLCEHELRKNPSSEDKREFFLKLEKLTNDYSETIRIACADFDFPTYRQFIKPGFIMRAALPLRALVEYIKETAAGRQDSELAMVTLRAHCSNAIGRCPSFSQYIDARKEAIKTALLELECRHDGISQSPGCIDVFQHFIKEFQGFDEEFFQALSVKKAKSFEKVLSNITTEQSAPDMDFLNGMRL